MNAIGWRRLHAPLGMLCAVLLSIGSFAASAEDSRLLTKAEVEGIVVGKNLRYVRATDGTTVTFDVRDGGKVYYAPQRTQRNLSIQGAWTISDDGALCFKWHSDQYVTMQDGCYRFRRTGEKTQVVGGRHPDNLLGDLVE
ncbi:MAG: DUF995 domain-containing protein [Burkholderiaceae bacterium]